MLNEALVKMALNVSEHRKTPVLHSTVGPFPRRLLPIIARQHWCGYCKLTPPPLAHVSSVLQQ